MTHRTASIREQVKAARAGYLLPAALIALWAALIPYLRDRLNLDSAGVAQLVFAFGAGSIAGMLAASPLTKYFGSRLTCFASVLGAATGIVVISLSSVFLLTVIFACFFALCAGCLEVGINIYGASLERQFKLRLMIPLHAYYSAGEVTGAACCLLLLNFNLPPFLVICALSLICLALALFYFPSIVNFNFRARKEQSFMLPTRQVSCLCLIVLITYMTGGAMVDWSGIYLADHSCLDLRQAVIGYTLVSVAMMLCRMFGNFLQDKIGTLRLVLCGCALLICGLLLLSLRPGLILMLLAFVLIGCGMSNITPLSYAAAARQRDMPLLPAVSAMSVAGYGGLLAGPALLGAAAYYISLAGVFGLLSVLCCISLLCIIRVRSYYK